MTLTTIPALVRLLALALTLALAVSGWMGFFLYITR